jgi:hypothetical protein
MASNADDLLVQIVGKFYFWRLFQMGLSQDTQTKIEKALTDRANVVRAEESLAGFKQVATGSAQEALTAVAGELGLAVPQPQPQ